MMESYHGIQIVYEDNHLLVVVKPPNMPTQADASGDPDLHSTMKRYIAEKYQKPGAVYLGLVHRLDRPVGGLVVLARTSKAADRLSGQVREKTLARQYVAAVRGSAPERIELCDWLLKDERTNTVRAVAAGTPGAKDAHLTWQKAGEADGLSLIRVKLFTGRSHPAGQARLCAQHHAPAGYPHPREQPRAGGLSRPVQRVRQGLPVRVLQQPSRLRHRQAVRGACAA